MNACIFPTKASEQCQSSQIQMTWFFVDSMYTSLIRMFILIFLPFVTFLWWTHQKGCLDFACGAEFGHVFGFYILKLCPVSWAKTVKQIVLNFLQFNFLTDKLDLSESGASGHNKNIIIVMWSVRQHSVLRNKKDISKRNPWKRN